MIILLSLLLWPCLSSLSKSIHSQSILSRLHQHTLLVFSFKALPLPIISRSVTERFILTGPWYYQPPVNISNCFMLWLMLSFIIRRNFPSTSIKVTHYLPSNPSLNLPLAKLSTKNLAVVRMLMFYDCCLLGWTVLSHCFLVHPPLCVSACCYLQRSL